MGCGSGSTRRSGWASTTRRDASSTTAAPAAETPGERVNWWRSSPLVARAWYWSGRWPPQGWFDALRQLGLFAGAYYAYRIVRGIVDGDVTAAFSHARSLVGLERGMHTFFEPQLQHWALKSGFILDVANWMYVNSHFTITTTFIIWLYLARNHAYYYVRNMFMIAMGLALVGYVVFP